MPFDKVLGHAQAKKQLESMLSAEQVPHALLFEGPRGVGKSLLALELAKALLCPDELRPCEKCSSCRKTDQKMHPDLRWIAPNAKSNILIADIRGMRAGVIFTPVESRAQVVVIDSSDQMNAEAQNSLLKILEEPPPLVFFILVSSEPSGLFATVRSRCQSVRMGALSQDEVREILETRCGVSKEDSRRLWARCGPSLERLERFRDPKTLETEERVFQDIREARSPNILPLKEGFGMKREELTLYFEMMEELFRDLYLIRAGCGEIDRFFWPDRARELKEFATKYTGEEIPEILTALAAARDDLRRFVNPKLVYLNMGRDIGMRWFKDDESWAKSFI